jgi:AraC family transcriptional regulator of adaptative response / DNA-3-methyladenine glycosylase II
MTTTADQAKLSDPLFAERYRAMSSRDARFDGQFITGVHSTGIYCRPSCPAITPKASNVSFYLTTAAAHEAGLRACKRCLPDAVPGSPEWNVRDDLAARAMRLIADGTVEREGVPGLASRLGYTPRHLGRVLVTELGAGPLALSRAHRAQTARLLLAGTELSITDVAFAAGFSSVRQFNETIAAIYRTTPGAIRSSRGATQVTAASTRSTASASTGHPATLTLRLPARAPFDGAGVFGFLFARAIPGVEAGDHASYARTMRLPHGVASVILRLSGTDAAPAVTCEASLADVADLAPLVARVRRLLDLDADAQAIDDALAADPALRASVHAAPGRRVPGSVDGEETLFRAIVGQQVSVAGARTTLTRLTEALGSTVQFGSTGQVGSAGQFGSAGQVGAFTHVFPTAAQIAAGGREVLRGPTRRIETIVAVAEALATGDLVIDLGESREDLESRLTALPGIGPWTAGYVAMRVLGSPDILLTSDLAIRQGAVRLGLPGEARALESRATAWAPWRSYAGMHLWRAAQA